jgi:hypothetical protein
MSLSAQNPVEIANAIKFLKVRIEKLANTDNPKTYSIACKFLYRLTGQDPKMKNFDISSITNRSLLTIKEFTMESKSLIENKTLTRELCKSIRKIYFLNKLAPYEFKIDEKKLQWQIFAESNCKVGFGYLNGIPVVVKKIPDKYFDPEEIDISLYIDYSFLTA